MRHFSIEYISKHLLTNFPFSLLLQFNAVSKNSFQEQFANTWQIKRVGLTAIKFEKLQSLIYWNYRRAGRSGWSRRSLKKTVFVNKMTLDVLYSLIRVSRHKTQTYNSVQCNTTDEAIKCLSDYMQLTAGAGKRVWKLMFGWKKSARGFLNQSQIVSVGNLPYLIKRRPLVPYLPDTS